MDKTEKDESFRDSIATINEDGKRNWIYAKKPAGRLYRMRTIATIVFLSLFFSLPFIHVNGSPVFLFNILERRFIFFGVTFWPQDFFIFGLGMITFVLFIVLFTVVFGRVFCGWACPQTIFMEMVFRKIEYLIEGDSAAQKLLDKSPWNAEKIRKKTLKHSVFFLIAFIIANTFLAYIIGTDELGDMIRRPIGENIGTLISLLIFTGVFYAVYARFREQVCLIVCPYGRLQGVMLDKNSIVVAYDYVRGEPRAKIHKNEVRTEGDCIDCFQCVKVCPTGIDIRNGTQLECVNCTACIDACDYMMEKTGLPKGLIRYASETGIKERSKLKITPRIMAYSFVLTILVGVLVSLLITRKDVDVTILRTPGMLYQTQQNDTISNLYNVKILNKTHSNIPVELKLEAPGGSIRLIGKQITVNKESKGESELFVLLPKSMITDRKMKVQIGV